jgi:4-diphosphocytidyl-2-C-methyl-D-erythritol kinase
MPVYTELARAKVNLTLEVLGRRPDGYHELASLVAFADIGDVVTLDTDAAETRVTVSGPFAQALVGENLIETALRRLREAHPALKLGALHLDKRLPVAAGIGGGSADAAAVLRAVRRANPGASADVAWDRIAASLGADVPVCLASATAWMTGIGERLQPVVGLPGLSAVLVNALGPVPSDKTTRVFRALNAQPVGPGTGSDAVPTALTHAATERPDEAGAALLAFMRARGNSLQPATLKVVPDVAEVLAELRHWGAAQPSPSHDGQRTDAPILVAMSGAGPTCFALFANDAAATAASAYVRQQRPSWWVAATRIG